MFSFGGIPQKKEWHLPPTKKRTQKKPVMKALTFDDQHAMMWVLACYLLSV